MTTRTLADEPPAPCPKPGAGRIVDDKLLTYIKVTVGKCEWPECGKTATLAAHHIFGRGSGGGKRSDHPDRVAVLCFRHHLAAHTSEWWNPAGQARLHGMTVLTRDRFLTESLTKWADELQARKAARRLKAKPEPVPEGEMMARAWKEWCASTDGQECVKATTLGVTGRQAPFLKNRLWRAFIAGANASLTTMATKLREGR